MWRDAGKRNLKVLLIEDNPSQIMVLKEVLEESGVTMDLEVRTDGETALTDLRREEEVGLRPDLIMLDLRLPGMDGHQVLRELKGDEELRVIPVIVLSTSQADDDVLRCYRMGANCYIVKPVDLDRFIEMIKAVESFWCHTARLPTE
jgi:chemotaxis family two-component system response regulator Rcp1